MHSRSYNPSNTASSERGLCLCTTIHSRSTERLTSRLCCPMQHLGIRCSRGSIGCSSAQRMRLWKEALVKLPGCLETSLICNRGCICGAHPGTAVHPIYNVHSSPIIAAISILVESWNSIDISDQSIQDEGHIPPPHISRTISHHFQHHPSFFALLPPPSSKRRRRHPVDSRSADRNMHRHSTGCLLQHRHHSRSRDRPLPTPNTFGYRGGLGT